MSSARYTASGRYSIPYNTMAALRDYAGPSARKFSELARAYGAKLEDVNDFLSSEGEEVESSLSRQEVLRARIAADQQELTELERFPEDNFEVGTIVAFDRKFKNSAQTFHYAAIKGTETQWYLSGLIASLISTPVTREQQRRVDWDRLTYAMRSATNIRVIFRHDGYPLTVRPDEPRIDHVAEEQLRRNPLVGQSIDEFLAKVRERDGFLSTTTAPRYDKVDLGEQPVTEAPTTPPVHDPNRD